MNDVFAPNSLSWGLGIEDTCVYGADATPLLDEHRLTQHEVKREADLGQVKDLGATFLRYGVSWPAVHPAPGRFEWGAFDRVVERCQDLGVDIVADLVHYGTPGWLTGAFCSADYADTYVEYLGAFGDRYRGAVACASPVNEPLTTASFCGLRGVWPPYAKGWPGWAEVTAAIADGIVRGSRVLRDVAPEMTIVHVEAASDFSSSEPGLAEATAFHQRIGWLPTDLVLGRVGAEHEMYGWLRDMGVDPALLDRLHAVPAEIDILGVNYYPDLTPRTLESRDGEVIQRAYDGGAHGLESTLRAFAARYAKPLIVTETSIEGDDERRAGWMHKAAEVVGAVAAAGVDVRGLTWWPLMDFVDWSWASGGNYVEEFRNDSLISRADAHGEDGFLRRMGLIRLDRRADGDLARIPTRAAEAFATIARPHSYSTGH